MKTGFTLPYLTFAFLLLNSLFSLYASGSPGTQTLHLRQGWNAIYLEIQPDSGSCVEVFSEIPVESVWMWNPPLTSEQFIDIPTDPESLIRNELWLVYAPGHAVASNLHHVLGGRAYLIKASEPTEWRVEGNPCLPQIKWQPQSWNFVGFHVHPEGQQNFISYFDAKGTPFLTNIDEIRVYGLFNNEWSGISPNDTLHAGAAYWVYADRHSNFTGPLVVEPELGDVVDFGAILNDQTVTVRNDSERNFSNISIEIVVDCNESESNFKPPFVLLDPNDYTIESLRAGEEITVGLRVTRPLLHDSCAGLLCVSEPNWAGMRVIVPVKAERHPDSDQALWVGTATVNQVSLPETSDPARTWPASSEFLLRLILLEDRLEGVTYILDEAVVFCDSESDNPSLMIETEGLTASEYLAGSEETTIRSAFRVSSAGFAIRGGDGPFSSGVRMTGEFGVKLQGDFGIKDQLNPFRHFRHPGHDGLNDKGEEDIDEVYPVTRSIALSFSQSKPEDDVRLADNNIRAGRYVETLYGLIGKNKLTGMDKPVCVSGTFEIRKVAQTGMPQVEASE